MKLKTLKEIGKDKNRDCCSVADGYNNICEMCIRQEAIKWVKQWTKEKSKMRQDEMAYWCYMGRIHALETFHNITEEDLK